MKETLEELKQFEEDSVLTQLATALYKVIGV
jgi:hypothetical protein